MAIVARHGIGYKEIEAATGIAGTTLRRYARRFPAFLPCRMVDRAARFQEEAVDTFRRVHQLYQDGKRTEEIAAILAEEVPQVHEVATPATTDATPPHAAGHAELVSVVDRLATAMERQAVALESIAARLAVIEASNTPVGASQLENDTDTQASQEKPVNRPWWRRVFGCGDRGK